MEETTYTANDTVESVSSTPTAEDPKPKAKRAKKPRKRTADELQDVRPEKMTDAERIECIKHLREANQLLENKNVELDRTCKQAFEMFKNSDQAYKDLKATINRYMRQLEMHAKCGYEAIHMLLERGVNA